MPRRKGTPVYAERGANPVQVRFDGPEGWTGAEGRIARAARNAGFPTASEYMRRRLDEAMTKDGV